MKNLIILDHCVESWYFINDIYLLSIPHIDQFVNLKQQESNCWLIYLKALKGLDYFIKKYFKFIQAKAKIYSYKTSSYNVAKEDLKSYFRSLEVNKLLEEAENA